MGSGFKGLLVWQRARDLAIEVYRLTAHKNFRRDFGLTDQMRRAGVSIPSNIAEGDERDTDKDAIRFLYIAKGSIAELRTQLDIANQIDYIDDNDFKNLDEKAAILGRMIGSLIKSRKKKDSV